VRDRGGGRSQVHLRRQPPGARGPLGKHLLSRLRRPPDRALRLRHRAKQARCPGALPHLRPRHSGRVVLAVVLLQVAVSFTPGLGTGARALGFDAATFDPIVLGGIRAGAYPGAAFVVGRRDTILFAKGYGRLTWSPSSRAVSPESTLYDLASLTKVVVTTTAAMLLVERGRLDLDAPAVRYVEEFAGPGTAGVTLRQLPPPTTRLRAPPPPYEEPGSAPPPPPPFPVAPHGPPGARVIFSDL